MTENGDSYAKRKEPEPYSMPIEIFDAFEQKTRNKLIKLYRGANIRRSIPKAGEDSRIKIQLKDIQLKFPYPSESFETGDFELNKVCWGCFNNPCTCENKGSHRNPYCTKKHSDLHLEKVNEKSKKKA